MIPKVIHQVWDGPMVPGIQECLDSVKRVMPDYDVVVHSGADMDELVPDQFSAVERSNRFRNHVLHQHGGWWIDADCYALRPLNSDQAHSFGKQEMRTWSNCHSPMVVDWAFGSEAGNPVFPRIVKRLGTDRVHRRSSNGDSASFSSMPPLGQHMAKVLGGGKLEPHYVYGSRRFSHRSPSKQTPRNATLVHLFLGSWYKAGWRNGVLSEVKEAQRWG